MSLGEVIHIACWVVLVYAPLMFGLSYVVHHKCGYRAPWERRR